MSKIFSQKRRKKFNILQNYAIDKVSTGIIIKIMIIESIAKAIKKSGKSYSQISEDTRIDRAVLCRIASGSGTGSCSTKTADILLKYFGLELVAKKPK